MKAKILWIEGRKGGSPALIAALTKKGHLVELAVNAKTAIEHVQHFEPDLVILHYPSIHSGAKRLCRSLNETLNGQPLVCIANAEETFTEDCGISEVLKMPLTARKLTKCVERLLPSVLVTGPMTLNLEDYTIVCDGCQERLTPRLAKLLQKFMQHPGEVLERKKLFGSVWNTDYTDDTRTLDVHISWLRRIIEKKPAQPVHIVTIRGVGYRLDI